MVCFDQKDSDKIMLKKVVFASLKIIIAVVLVFIYFDSLKNSYSKLKNSYNNLYYENHATYKEGQVTLYKYNEENYCFNDNDKEMISDILKPINVFANDLFKVKDCGSRKIDFSVNDYNSFGTIILYSNSSFEQVKLWFENNYNSENIEFYDFKFLLFIDDVNIQVYKTDNGFKMIYVTELPYRYMINEIGNYSAFQQYFLNFNFEKNK